MNQLYTTTLLAATIVATAVIAQPTTVGGPPPQKDKKKEVAKIGEPAPAFSLQDQWGETHILKEYEGKIVVLEWFNEGCPYCLQVWKSGLVPLTVEQLGKMDDEVVYLAVNSTANKPKAEIQKSGAKFLEDLESTTPMLMDYNGKVGHMYGAKTTPHIFIIDAEGILVYQGAMSDDPRGKEGKKAKTHTVRVVEQLQNDEEVKPNYIKPWGCPVKYARSGSGKERRRPRRGGGASGAPK
jgi:peroxiredoxin